MADYLLSPDIKDNMQKKLPTIKNSTAKEKNNEFTTKRCRNSRLCAQRYGTFQEWLFPQCARRRYFCGHHQRSAGPQ